MKKLLLVVNPTSGKLRIKTELLRIVKAFSDGNYDVRVYVTKRRQDATRFVESEGKAYDRIVVCGGDGTFNEVVAGALKARFEGDLGFLPFGTTNDYAATLGIPKRLSSALELMVKGEGSPMDFGAFNRGRFFSYIAAFGAFTDVTYTTDQNLKNLFGHAAYVAEAISGLKDLRDYHVRVECDGNVYEDDFLFGAVANSFSIGGVMKLKKDTVSLTDGYFEVLLIRNPKNAQDLANLSKELLSGIFENKSVLFFRGKKIQLTCDEEIPWCLDGEYAGMHESVTARNLHGRLRIIAPDRK